jgi:mutator protein MutT
MLFEVRSNTLKTQPGDVCFPGGEIEQGETPLNCAIREMEEEIGINPENVKILGQFDTLYSFSGYTLYTFVVALQEDALDQLKLNEKEVAEIFTVPLSLLHDTPAKNYDVDVISDVKDFPYEETGISPSYQWRKGKNILPLYKYESETGEKIIWGVTARIAKWVVDKLVYNSSEKP